MLICDSLGLVVLISLHWTKPMSRCPLALVVWYVSALFCCNWLWWL